MLQGLITQDFLTVTMRTWNCAFDCFDSSVTWVLIPIHTMYTRNSAPLLLLTVCSVIAAIGYLLDRLCTRP